MAGADESVYSQFERHLGIKTVLADDVLLLRHIRGTEHLSEISTYEVELLSTSPRIAASRLLGTAASIRISPPGMRARSFRGYFTRFERVAGDMGSRFARYRATLKPWIWFLSIGRECRIFQRRSVPEIVHQLVEVPGSACAVEHRLVDRLVYGKHRYRVQYQESTLNFARRLLEDEGVFWYIDEDEKSQRFVLCDSPSLCPAAALTGPLWIRDRTESVEEERLSEWTVSEEVRPTLFSAKDYNFKKPRAHMIADRGDDAPNSPVRTEVFEYPGGYMRVAEGEAQVARVRLGELLTGRSIYEGRTNCPTVAAGRLFSIHSEPFSEGGDKEFLATAVEFEAFNQAFDQAPGHANRGSVPPVYQARVKAIRRVDEYRPARVTPKPVMRGPQTAIVVGRKGDEVYADRHARVCVRFHWDRYADGTDASSCWLRVSQAWAGKRYGWLSLPRVGHEVIVDFLDGDPDRPIVTGRVYNGDNMPPVSNAGREVAHKPVAGSGGAKPSHRVEGVPSGERPPHSASGQVTVPPANPNSDRESTEAGQGTPVDGVHNLVTGNSNLPPKGDLLRPMPRPTPGVGLGTGSLSSSGQGFTSEDDDDDDDALPPGVAANIQMTTFKSDSLNGAQGANEITINDSGSKEGLFFNAQYNEVHVVGNDRIDQVGNNEMVSIGQNRVEDIGQNAQETVGVAKVIDVGKTLLIKAGVSITLQCGASTIHMNQAGFITISGMVINVAGGVNCNMAAPMTNIVGGILMTTTGAVNLSSGMLHKVTGGMLASMSAPQAQIEGGTATTVNGGQVLINC